MLDRHEVQRVPLEKRRMVIVVGQKRPLMKGVGLALRSGAVGAGKAAVGAARAAGKAAAAAEEARDNLTYAADAMKAAAINKAAELKGLISGPPPVW